MEDFFDIEHYVKILSQYETYQIREYKNIDKGLLLRHDIDFSIDMAYELAMLEYDYQINSTYYVLITSDLYNPFSLSNRKKLLEMRNKGFEIGLHFDPIVYGNIDEKELLQKFKTEISVFENIIESKIYSYSMHQPTSSGIYLKYDNLIDAYDKEIFNSLTYISDSCYSFREKNPYEFLKKSKNNIVQFLIHPVHLHGKGVSYEKQFNKILNSTFNQLDGIKDLNFTYKEQRKGYKFKIGFEYE